MTAPIVPLADLVAELRAMRSIPCLTAADRLEKETARLCGGTSCQVCGSTDPTIRNVMPDNVGRRLFPDAPEVHTMSCYWDEYHDPQAALAVLASMIEYADEQLYGSAP